MDKAKDYQSMHRSPYISFCKKCGHKLKFNVHTGFNSKHICKPKEEELDSEP